MISQILQAHLTEQIHKVIAIHPEYLLNFLRVPRQQMSEYLDEALNAQGELVRGLLAAEG